MSPSPPTPPQQQPDEIGEKLDEQSPEVLRCIARFADELAQHPEREARITEQDGKNEEPEGYPDDRPDAVPSKATITVKVINEKRCYYWWWRDGDRNESKYKGPVSSDE